MADTVPFQMRVPRVLMERLRALSSERGTTVTDLLLGPWSLPTFEERPASPAVEVTPPVAPVGPAFVPRRVVADVVYVPPGSPLRDAAGGVSLSDYASGGLSDQSGGLDAARPASLPPPLLVPVSPKGVVEPFFRGGPKKRSRKGK